MSIRVALDRVENYNPEIIHATIKQQLEALGGITRFVKPGQTVLLKPNMLAGKAPEKAVTTHPEIVRAVITIVQEAGGTVLVGDSPGIGTSAQVARKCGIMPVIEACGATFTPFTESCRVPTKGGVFKHLELAREALEADVIINLPKLKTHQMMGLTCGIKNMFGAVVGTRKLRLHLQAGTNKSFFAQMLIDVESHLAPALTIVDGITAMEGDGPGSGDPVNLGILMSSPSGLAVDTVACRLLGLTQKTVWTQQVAAEQSLAGSSLDDLELIGEPLDELAVKNFRPAKNTDVNFNLPGFLKRPLKKSLTARPEPAHDLCTRCRECVVSCPPQAMVIENDRLAIDFDRCIRCFCCQELCPFGALETRQGLLLKLSTWFGGKR